MKGQQQTYTYEKVLNEILQHTKRKFSSGNDKAKSLRTGMVKTFTEPTLQTTGMRMEEKQAWTATTLTKKGEEIEPDILKSETVKVPVAVVLKEDKMKFKIDYKIYVKEQKLYKYLT